MGSIQLIPPLPQGFKLDDIPPLPPGFTLDAEAKDEFANTLPGARAVLGPETYFGRQMAGQREGLQQAPLVDLTAATPAPGILRGAARFASGLTTPTNLALAGGMGILGAAPAAMKLPQIAAGIFTADMAKAAYEQYPQFKAAVDAGDVDAAKEIGTELVLTGAFAGLTGRHALKGPQGLLKGAPRDTQNIQGLPSEVRVREEPVEAKPVERAGAEEAPAGGILQAQREVVPPLPEGFKLDVEVPSAEPALQLEPTAVPAGGRRPGRNAGDRGRAGQPAESLLPEPQTPEDRAIREYAIQKVNELADEFSEGFPTKTKGDVIPEEGQGYRRWEGRNIEDIPIAADVFYQYRHGPQTIANALKKRQGKIWDRLVQKAEEYERAKPKGEAYEGPTAFGGEADTSFDFAEPAAPVSIADFSQQMAKAGERAKGEAANEIVGQLGMKAAGPQKRMADLEGSPLFPKAEEPSLFGATDTPEGWANRWKSYADEMRKPENKPPEFTGGPEAGSLPVFKDVEQMPLPKYAGSINLERVGADYPVKKLIRDVADQYKGKISERRRGVITHEETRALAEDLGMTETQLLKRRLGKAFNAEEVTASRDILNASARRLGLLREQWAKSGSEEAIVEFHKALDRHAEIQAEVSGVATEAGRALSAHRIISEPAKGYKKMLDALGGRELNEEILKQFGRIDPGDARQVHAFVRQYAKVTGWDMFYEAWRAMLLSGPKTHIVNTTSNLITLATRGPETLATAAVEAGLSKLQGRARERFFSEVKPEAIGALAGIKDGARAALAAWREELPLELESKLEISRHAIPGKVGKAIRIPFRALSAADEMFKAINYSAEAYQLAYRKARLEGTPKEKIPDQVAQHLQDKDIQEKADHAARYWTFNQPMGPWTSLVNKLRMTIPGAKYIVPWLRTPANIAKFSLERTPANFFRILREAKRGNLKDAALAEELAKPILGSLIGATVTMLAAEGLITGSGPKNQNERETLQRSGWLPYAFKIGDRYYSYGRLEPVGSIAGMAADFVELGGTANPGAATQKIATSISKNLTSKTFLQGLSDTLDALSDPQRFGSKFLKGYAGTLVPNIIGTGAQVVDPYVRMTEGPLESMQSKIPGLSQKLPARRDLFGRPISKLGTTALERGLSPFPVKKISSDFVDQELVRIKAWLGDLDKQNMTNEQFEEYAQRVGKALRPRLEVILRSDLQEEIKRQKVKAIASEVRVQTKKAMGLLKKAG